ncbi:hypothetical protein VTL71DRAFT_13628 [Oculimacula yallundae]|uniref:Hemerythrin-like domain-containing protein n=1 Tax=Oculimacula yallundae TaxID=86028 RepID=A0ABR4CLI3_9HELO
MLVSEGIGQDHQYLYECCDKLKAASTTEDKVKWRNMLVWNLARHAISEDLTVKEDLFKLQSFSPASPSFSPPLEQLMADLHHHIEHEKDTDMPLLENAISETESERIAMSFMRTKKLVSTKSHPDAPTSSPLTESLAGLLAAPVDKLRTLMETFPDEETGSAEVDWSQMI